MKKLFILCFIGLLFACNQEGTIDNEKFVMWNAYPTATISDGGIQLSWFNYSVNNYILLPFQWVNPDKFEIYISKNDMSNFRKLTELDNDESYTCTVDKLQNDVPCFFYMVSKKKGYKSQTSDTIMAVPNKRKDFEILQSTQSSGDAHTLWNVSIANRKNKIAYSDAYYTWDCGTYTCMDISVIIANMDGSEQELMAISSYHPCWSPGNDKIIFRTEMGEVSQEYGRPSQIALYDFDTKSVTKLTEGNDFNDAPVFSGNGEFFLYQSNKNVNVYATNIWMMNLITMETFQITDISKTTLRTVERPCWMDDDRFLFHGINAEEKYQLFESSVSKKQINKLFDSQWNDYTPSVSPNRNKIAFISKRSGTNQVWIYDIDSKRYHQITGYSNSEGVEPTWNNIEWLDNTTIVFTLNSDLYNLVRHKVE